MIENKYDATFAIKVRDELSKALENYGPVHSAHEGYAVLLEEVDELWEIVRQHPLNRDIEAMKKECIQISAMAYKIYNDCCEVSGNAYRK